MGGKVFLVGFENSISGRGCGEARLLASATLHEAALMGSEMEWASCRWSAKPAGTLAAPAPVPQLSTSGPRGPAALSPRGPAARALTKDTDFYKAL